MEFLQAASVVSISWHDVVLYMLAGFGGLVLMLSALQLGLDDIGPRIYKVRQSWADFKHNATRPVKHPEENVPTPGLGKDVIQSAP